MNPKLDLINRVKADIQHYRKGKLDTLPTYAEYAKTFAISKSAVRDGLREGLLKDDRDYLVSSLRSQSGRKNKGAKDYHGGNFTPDQRILNNLRAEKSEKLAKKQLEQEGWHVFYLMVNAGIVEQPFKKEYNYEALRGLKNGIKILNDMENVRKELRKCAMPDFICEKGEDTMFVEVKSFELKKNQSIRQKRFLDAICKRGYSTRIMSILVDVNEL